MCCEWLPFDFLMFLTKKGYLPCSTRIFRGFQRQWDSRLGEDEGLYEKQGENNEPLRRSRELAFSPSSCTSNCWRTLLGCLL